MQTSERVKSSSACRKGHACVFHSPMLVGLHLCMQSRNDALQGSFLVHANCFVHLSHVHAPDFHVPRY